MVLIEEKVSPLSSFSLFQTLTSSNISEETYVYRRNVVITSYSTVVSEWTAAGDDDDSEDELTNGKKGKGKAKAGKGGVLFQGGEFTFHRSEF